MTHGRQKEKKKGRRGGGGGGGGGGQTTGRFWAQKRDIINPLIKFWGVPKRLSGREKKRKN